MTDGLSRATIFPEPGLPDFDRLIAEGRNTSLPVDVGDMLARLADLAEERGEATGD